MTDKQLAALATLYFGGRDRAAHVMACDDCVVDGDGSHLICVNHPDHQGRTRLMQRASAGRA